MLFPDVFFSDVFLSYVFFPDAFPSYVFLWDVLFSDVFFSDVFLWDVLFPEFSSQMCSCQIHVLFSDVFFSGVLLSDSSMKCSSQTSLCHMCCSLMCLSQMSSYEMCSYQVCSSQICPLLRWKPIHFRCLIMHVMCSSLMYISLDVLSEKLNLTLWLFLIVK